MLIGLVNLVLAIWNTVFRGFLIKTFWVWFLLPLFPNLPALHILPAIGLSYLVSAFTPWKSLTQKDLDDLKDTSNHERTTLTFINGIVYTLAISLVLLGGYIVHCFM